MAHWTDFLDPDGPDGAYLPWKKVEPRVGISRTTAWRLQKAGEFPKPYVVSSGRVAYRESEVEAWKASRRHRAADARRHAETRRLDSPSAAAAAAEPPAPRAPFSLAAASPMQPAQPVRVARSSRPRTRKPPGEVGPRS